MIKIQNSDSIIDIIRKIENSKKNEIVLIFPIGNTILHNYTSLKILKNSVQNKELIIITKDISAKKIGKTLGIKYSILKDENIIKNIDLLKYNYTFFEFLIFLIKSYSKECLLFFKNRTKNTEINSKYNKILNYRYTKNDKSKLGLFFLGLLSSLFILLFIFYFAVNKTYVTITPETIIKTKAKNIIFKEVGNNKVVEGKNEVKISKISKTIYLTKTFQTTGIDENTLQRSNGEVLITNKTDNNISLIKNSRLKSNDGALFTINNITLIPKAQINQSGSVVPGTLKVYVTAKPFDENGKSIGIQGNIKKGTFLYFPGLDDAFHNLIYGESLSNFTGGTDIYHHVVGNNDLENAKKNIETSLKIATLKELKKDIEEDNKKNNTKNEILGIDDAIQYSNLSLENGTNIKKGDEITNFTLTGSLMLSTYIFDQDMVINKLRAVIREGLIEDIENLDLINENSLRIANVLYKNSSPFEIKATAEIEAFYSHNFLSQKNNYIEKLKESISGLTKDEAIKILINNQKIGDVQIEIRPFFINTISKIPNNIIFNVNKK